MPASKAYRRKPGTVLARKLLVTETIVLDDKSSVVAQVGEWVVENGDSKAVLSDEDFNLLYQPAKG